MTVMPYGPLYLVPFAALLDSGNSYLVEKHALAYLPSIAVLRATGDMKQRLAGLEDKLLAFGNPITERNKFIGKLPYAEKEVAKVASIFNQVNKEATHIEVGEAATKRKFAELAPGYSYIHLATHGLIDSDSPMDSSVVLAPEGDDDGLLTVKDILELPALKAKLIVLSACQTGKGKVTGDGVIGLSRAFIIAGTPSVMVSQWNVDDVMTEFQMALLYKELLSGQKKARALRVAQLKTINFMEKGLASSFADESEDDDAETGKKAKERANPRYWAAFQVIGEAD
ncbi:MAG TPA: CHAT domain-containing protein [Candidatus Melainabacteria bacterium]|nr:CHAT domain-containing protein [Candidatus Melainabacteria bacterium]